MFASVIIPGFVINRITWGAGILSKRTKLPGIARKWLPTCFGLAAIPFIIRPIDTAVDHAMDATYRKYVWAWAKQSNKQKNYAQITNLVD